MPLLVTISGGRSVGSSTRSSEPMGLVFVGYAMTTTTLSSSTPVGERQTVTYVNMPQSVATKYCESHAIAVALEGTVNTNRESISAP